MLKRWWLILFFAIAFTLFDRQSVWALRSNNESNNCINFKNGNIICPDPFCDASSFSCSVDGTRCHCVPAMFSSSNLSGKNKKCRVPTGSKMYYDSDSKQIYLSGGIWGSLAKKLTKDKKTTYVDKNHLGQLAIIFKQRKDDSKKYYSGFLTDLSDKNKEMGIELSGEINDDASLGFVKDQFFYMGSGKNKQLCALGPRQNANNASSFINKNIAGVQFWQGTMLDFDPLSKDKNENPCFLPANTLIDYFYDFQSLLPATINCEKRFNTELNGKKTRDLHLLASNMIVSRYPTLGIIPNRTSVHVVSSKSKELFLGEDFSIENKKSRDDKIKRIEEKQKKYCKNKNNFVDKINFCEEYKTGFEILMLLKNNPKFSFRRALAENLISGNPAKKLINWNLLSYANEKNEENVTDAPTLDEFATRRKQNNMPMGLKKICATLANIRKQKKCEQVAFDALNANIDNSGNAPKTCYDVATGELERVQWLICPVYNTSVIAVGPFEKFIMEQFKNPVSFLNNNGFKKAHQNILIVANVLVVLAFLVILVLQISNVGLANYHIKKSLPRLVGALIATNLSYLLMQILVDLSNLFGSGFIQFAYQVSSSAPKVNIMAEFLSFEGVGSVFLFLILAIPIIIIMIIGLIVGFVSYVINKAILIMAILLSPIAFASMAIPQFNSFFVFWRKKITSAILLYPVLCSMAGFAVLTQSIILTVNGVNQNSLLKLVALVLPGVNLLVAPFLAKKLINLAESTINSFNNLETKSKKAIENSNFVKDVRKNRSRTISKIPFFGGVLSNNTVRTKTLQNNKDRQYYKQLIKNDIKLVKAFSIEGKNKGSLYKSLSEGQKQHYNQLLELGAHRNKDFYIDMMEELALNGHMDKGDYEKVIIKGKEAGLDDAKINSSLFVAHKMLIKKGNVDTAGLLKYIMSEVSTYPQTLPSSNGNLNNLNSDKENYKDLDEKKLIETTAGLFADADFSKIIDKNSEKKLSSTGDSLFLSAYKYNLNQIKYDENQTPDVEFSFLGDTLAHWDRINVKTRNEIESSVLDVSSEISKKSFKKEVKTIEEARNLFGIEKTSDIIYD